VVVPDLQDEDTNTHGNVHAHSDADRHGNPDGDSDANRNICPAYCRGADGCPAYGRASYGDSGSGRGGHTYGGARGRAAAGYGWSADG